MAIANQAARDAGQLAESLASGYFAYTSALVIARDPRALALIPAREPGQNVSVGRVVRKDGTEHIFWFERFLEKVREDSKIRENLEMAWMTGALLTIGNFLSRNDYFDKAPELELLRHLRNAVAHGNKFHITDAKRLGNNPAHNKLAWVRSDSGATFEVIPTLHGQPALFSFMGPGDILDLMMSVGLYLIRMGNGYSLRK